MCNQLKYGFAARKKHGRAPLQKLGYIYWLWVLECLCKMVNANP